MKLNYNVTGENRKQMVAVISQMAGVRPVYTRMPECAFLVGDIKVSKTGEMIWDERTDEELIGKVMEALSAAGFRAEEATETANTAEDATEAQGADNAGEATETQETGGTGEPTETNEADAPVTTGLIISFPLDGGSNGVAITEAVLENLRKLIASKATLIKKALKADRLTVEITEDRISFSWWDEISEDYIDGTFPEPVTVRVEAPHGAFPTGTTMKVRPIAEEQVREAVESVVPDPETVSRVSAVDITFLDVWGDEIEPDTEIKVSLTSASIPVDQEPVVVHVDDEGQAEMVKAKKEEEKRCSTRMAMRIHLSEKLSDGSIPPMGQVPITEQKR